MNDTVTPLERALVRRGFSKAEASRRTGIDPSVMTRLCKGQRRPSPVVARQLSDLLGVSPDDLGYGRIEAAHEVQAALATAQKRVARMEREAERLAAAAVAVLKALDRIDDAIDDARDRLRAALSMSQSTEES